MVTFEQEAANPGATPASMARALVARLGPHPATALALDLGDERDLGRWLVAAYLLGGPGDEARALDAFRALAGADLDATAALATASPGAVGALLEAAGHPRAERSAHQLHRACRALHERHRGSLSALAGEAETLESLGGCLAALGPGIGAATVARFLRPLRERWPAAAEVPLAPGARKAAGHLGLIDEGDDLEGEPGALRRALLAEGDAPALADVEWALERLGRIACGRGRAERCPMGAACPLASEREPRA